MTGYPHWIESTSDREALEGRPDHGGIEWEHRDRQLAQERAAALRAASVDTMTPFQSRVTRAPRASRWPQPPARKARRFTGAELGFLVCGVLLTVAWIALLAVTAWLVFG